MKDKIFEIFSLLRAGFKKTRILKQLNVSRTTVHRVEQHLKASENLKARHRLERPQVISQETIKKTFENDPRQKMTRQTQKKKILVSIVSKIIKKMEGKSLRCYRTPLLSAAIVQKRPKKSTRLLIISLKKQLAFIRSQKGQSRDRT